MIFLSAKVDQSTWDCDLSFCNNVMITFTYFLKQNFLSNVLCNGRTVACVHLLSRSGQTIGACTIVHYYGYVCVFLFFVVDFEPAFDDG